MFDALKNINWEGRTFGFDLLMINDNVRNQFYQNSLHDVKDKVVLDIGAGTGLLSVMAAHAGARLVYSFEHDPQNYTVAKTFIERAGLSDKIKLICADVLAVDKHSWNHEPIDVIVTETFANDCFTENFAFIVEHVQRSFNLKANHRWIPDRVDLTIGISNVYRNPEFNPGVSLPECYSLQINQAIDIYRDNLYHKYDSINLPVANVPAVMAENTKSLDTFIVNGQLRNKLDLAEYVIEQDFDHAYYPYLQVDWILHSEDRIMYLNRCPSWKSIAFKIDTNKGTKFYLRFHPITHALLVAQK